MRPVYEIATAEGAELRQCGETFRGLCLIHDRDGSIPSFQCGEDWFKCYSCGASGDGIAFVMKLKNFTFPQALAYLGENRPRPTRQDKAKQAKERRERADAKWNESELARTIGIAIRLCHEALSDITPNNLDEHALILTESETLNYQHDIMINGDPAARAELVRELVGLRLFKRTLLFKKNFDFRGWLRSVNKPQPPVEVVQEPHEQPPRIEILFG
jgi:hypothetical protein